MESKEDILRESLIEEVECQFSIVDEWKIVPYFLMRKQLIEGINGRSTLFPIHYLSLGEFILSELRIEVEEGYLTLNDDRIEAEAGYGTDLQNLLQGFWFQTKMRKSVSKNEWENKLNAILKISTKEIPVKKNHEMYKSYFMLRALNVLNKAFEVEVTGEVGRRFKHEPMALFRLTKEEELMRTIETFEHTLHIRTDVSEEELEQYLMRNLHVLQPDLKMIGNQVVLPEGRMDILAREAGGRDVIIEVKVEKDTDIIWQRMYYELEWKKRGNDPRMMIVSSVPLSESIRELLARIGETEVFEVTPLVKKRQISELRIDNNYVITGKDQLQEMV